MTFITELRELMEKHSASIWFDADDGSDWNGITGEQMLLMVDGEVIFVVEHTTGIGAEDLVSEVEPEPEPEPEPATPAQRLAAMRYLKTLSWD